MKTRRGAIGNRGQRTRAHRRLTLFFVVLVLLFLSSCLSFSFCLRLRSILLFCSQAVVEIESVREGQKLQDYAAENCSMPYRAPELFEVGALPRVTEKTDIWVCVRSGQMTHQNHAEAGASLMLPWLFRTHFLCFLFLFFFFSLLFHCSSSRWAACSMPWPT